MQAIYAAENIGHFGLNLPATPTSPRRSAATPTCMVHRALIRALGLGAGGIADERRRHGSSDIAQPISDAERRAMAAERETTDRLIAGYLADRVGAEFAARISGVTRSACSCGWRRPAPTASCRPRPSATTTTATTRTCTPWSATAPAQAYRLGDTVRVRLVEAVPSAGALRFEMLSPGHAGSARRRQGPRPSRARDGAAHAAALTASVRPRAAPHASEPKPERILDARGRAEGRSCAPGPVMAHDGR